MNDDDKKTIEAMEMAISALTAQPETHEKRTETHECDLISRQAAIDFVDDVPYIKDHPNIGLLWKAWVEQLPPAQPEPEPVGCSGCRYERFGNRVCDVCSRFYVDRYEAERRTDEA